MKEPIHTGELGIVEAVAKLLASIEPKSETEMRNYNFATYIAPHLEMPGMRQRIPVGEVTPNEKAHRTEAT